MLLHALTFQTTNLDGETNLKIRKPLDLRGLRPKVEDVSCRGADEGRWLLDPAASALHVS